jgi:uncharacterized protein (DUF1800 family)|uniref:DUF1800 domain-containing protein n=1 Tax=Candidatus Planktophila sp. TaxID=2175601 RepID=UPI00404AB60F
METDRLEIARLYHRFGFGPRPGEFKAALASGLSATKTALLSVPTVDSGAAQVAEPNITNLGTRPDKKTSELIEFSIALRQQVKDLPLWWLDRMALSDHALTERMTWFWHGHWATAVGKLNHAYPIYLQNQTLRKYALGNFGEMTSAMLNDGALQFWLDGGENTAKSPNENLARELMELFVLGVNRYTETDVRELSRALTGYQIERSSGKVTFNRKRYDSNVKTILGTSTTFDGNSAATHLVNQPDNAKFISERLWYRFISSQIELPTDNLIENSFENRDISKLVAALTDSQILSNPSYSIVKPPVEWFVGVARYLKLTPSALKTPAQLLSYLDKLAQVPFNPPNVGGWPTDESWLSSASAQYRIQFAAWLVKQADLTALTAIAPNNRVAWLQDELGILAFSGRTRLALNGVKGTPAQLLQLAICSPEYVVSA